MPIEAKSTRVEQAPRESGERFTFSAGERLTRLPLFIAMTVLGLAAYLKGILPGQAAPVSSESPQGPQPDAETPLAWRLPENSAPYAQDLAGEIDPTMVGGIAAKAGSFSLDGPPPPWQGPYAVPDIPAITFAQQPAFSNPSIGAFFPAAFSLVGLNDNVPPAQSSGVSRAVPAEDAADDDGDDEDPADEEDDETDDDDPVNRPPGVGGPVRLHDVFAGQVVLIGLSDLLFGAVDPDGDPLSVTNLSITGAAVNRTVGGWQLVTAPGMLGPVSISYQVNDGRAWVDQSAHFDITRNVQSLTPYADIHVGTPYDDDIEGLAGDDVIDAMAGNDLVVGGDGDDHINGGTGDDHLFGNGGDDIIFGGAGHDIIWGGAGNDRLFGEAGDDTLHGGAGDDIIDGGAGADIVDGGDGDDRITGASGNDILLGGDGSDSLDGGDGADILLGEEGADHLIGGAGTDLLDGGAGNDRLEGGAGDDRIKGGAGDDHLLADAGSDDMDGGEGTDLLDYSAATSDVIVDMVGGAVFSAEFGEDTFTGIEHIATGAGDDLFVVGAVARVMSGGGGRDTFIFEVTDESPALSDRIVHEILDFVVGDRIRVRDYDMDREARAREADLFREIYDDDDDDWLISDLPIVVQHVRYDDVDNTIIKADITPGDAYEIIINIHGILLPINPNWVYA